MTKKVIQVPVEEELLNALDQVSKRQRKARAALIRQACLSYLQTIENEELDRIYQQGYKEIPEEKALGEVQIALTGQILSKESW
jgi:metal-responsive CopG/Arc/MetJ family transcriptional regulator